MTATGSGEDLSIATYTSYCYACMVAISDVFTSTDHDLAKLAVFTAMGMLFVLLSMLS